MILAGLAPKKSKVVILGLTFKENCPDTRNSKVNDIIVRLNEYDIKPLVVDPWASERDALHEYNVTLTKFEDIKDVDCIIVAVAHNEFRALSIDDLKKLYKKNSKNVLIDVKGLYKVEDLKKSDLEWWRL
jgi:UDP-N-acetyl-D-galactosamine dehydrogenase